MALTAKQRHRLKLLEYLGNPDNDFVDRTTQAQKVLGFVHQASLYNTFNKDELDEIESKALEIRRTKYKPGIAAADKALLAEAKAGDVPAIKLLYQRLENWSEKQKLDITGSISAELHVNFIKPVPKDKNGDKG